MIEDSRVEKTEIELMKKRMAREDVQKKPLSESNINTNVEDYVLSQNEKSWT